MRISICAMLVLIHISVALKTNIVSACSTPVFRYALERWQPDRYEVIVLHREPLTDSQNQLLESLGQSTRDENVPVNVTVRTIDLTQPLEQEDQQLLSAANPTEQSPWMLVRYPALTDTSRLAFSGPFDGETFRALIDSPARRAVVERIVGGDSAVWVLVESGDPVKDDAAEQLLRQRLGHLEKTLQLPSPVDSGINDLFPRDESSQESTTDAPLRLSWIRIGRDDPEERFFVSMLINSESDLHEFNEPIAIPIYGRGRSHYALVGKGINDDNIDQSCQFVCGSCSCEVKAQNPGADMLIRANWDQLIAGVFVEERSLPPLTGLGALESNQEKTSETTEVLPIATEPMPMATKGNDPPQTADLVRAPASESITTVTHINPIYSSVFVIVMLGLLVVTVGTLLIKSRQAGTN